MRVQGKRSQGPSWVVGVVAFVVLLLVVQNFRSRSGDTRVLNERFAARPPAGDSGKIDLSLPPLPTNVVGLARTAVARLAGGQQIPAMTPVASGGSIRVTISQLQSVAQGLHIAGEIVNVGKTPLQVSLGSFRFTDDQGTVYAAEGGSNTTLAAGQHAPLDLTLPIPKPTQLTLEVALPNQPPLKMILIQQH